MVSQPTGNHGLGIIWCGRIWPCALLQGQMRIAKLKSAYNLRFSTVTPPPPPQPQRFSFGCNNLKNISVSTFKFGTWVYMGNATKGIVW